MTLLRPPVFVWEVRRGGRPAEWSRGSAFFVHGNCMRRGIDLSRKHGAFDARWPSGRTDTSDRLPPARPLPAAEAAEALDWDPFSARYFRRQRRHDFEAQSAYAAYKQGREWRNSANSGSARLRLVPQESVHPTTEMEPEAAGARRLLAAVAAVQPWEGADDCTPATDIPRRAT